MLRDHSSRLRHANANAADLKFFPVFDESNAMPRFDKFLSACVQPKYWRALRFGVVPSLEHTKAFEGKDFLTVVDVGANKGQFAAFASARWRDARLICFEPLPSPRKRLAKVTSGVAEIHTSALGEEECETEMHIASREDSSSLLPLGERQKSLFEMRESHLVTVPVRRLDIVLDATALRRPVLVKIDVQGFEYEVLKGASRILQHVDALYVECSFVELYAGQHLAESVTHFLIEQGFSEKGRYNECIVDGMLVQADILFERL